jgi:hypothetical protein
VFRNSTENAVYLKTEYTDTSITVKVFGDNGGITIEGITSERRNFTDPEEYFEPDATVNPGEQELRDDGSPGFTADVTASSQIRTGPRRPGGLVYDLSDPYRYPPVRTAGGPSAHDPARAPCRCHTPAG